MNTPNPQIPSTGFLRLPQVLALIPVGRSTWWRGIQEGRFPKGIKLGPRTTAWRVSDITAIIETFNKRKEGGQ